MGQNGIQRVQTNFDLEYTINQCEKFCLIGLIIRKNSNYISSNTIGFRISNILLDTISLPKSDICALSK